MKNKGSVSIPAIVLIIIISIVAIFSIPAFKNLYENMMISKYNAEKNGVIEGAKTRFGADITSIKNDGILEYTVDELVKQGYIKEEDLKSEYDKNDKVLVIVKNGYVSYKFISGTTLFNKIFPNMTKIDDEYYYISNDAQNYISFNEDIYRIIKIDKDSNIVITKESTSDKIEKDEIENYLSTNYNDNYNDKYREIVIKLDVLDTKTYTNTISNDSTYLNYKDSFLILDNSEYKLFNQKSNQFVEGEKGYINPIVIIDNTVICESGDGSRINPYIVSFQR